MWRGVFDADIIAVQETWAGRPGFGEGACSEGDLNLWLRQAAAQAGEPPFLTFWGSNTAAPGENNGVAILVRAGPDIRASDHSASPCGRLQTLRVQWGGHSMHLVNTYWPCTGAPARGAFFHNVLQPALRRVGADAAVVLGDFNFTLDPAVDRHPAPSAQTAAGDRASTALLQMALPRHLDAFGNLHRGTPSFTYTTGRSQATFRGARLDRVHVPAGLTPSILAVKHVDADRGHRAVLVHLLPARPLQPRGPGRRAVPAALVGDAQSKRALDAYATAVATRAPAIPDAAFVAWFDGQLQGYVALARRLTAAWRQRTRVARAAAEAAQAVADAADAAVESAVGTANLAAAVVGAARARQALRRATNAYVSPAVRKAQAAWLHHGERACPLLTKLVQPPRSSSSVTALRSPGGNILTRNKGIARAFAEHYAAISAAPPRRRSCPPSSVECRRCGCGRWLSAPHPAGPGGLGWSCGGGR
jgi:exonuclease III